MRNQLRRCNDYCMTLMPPDNALDLHCTCDYQPNQNQSKQPKQLSLMQIIPSILFRRICSIASIRSAIMTRQTFPAANYLKPPLSLSLPHTHTYCVPLPKKYIQPLHTTASTLLGVIFTIPAATCLPTCCTTTPLPQPPPRIWSLALTYYQCHQHSLSTKP